MKIGTIVLAALLFVVGCQSNRDRLTIDQPTLTQKTQEQAQPGSELSDGDGLVLSWSLNRNDYVLEVLLRNISTNEIPVRAATGFFEADIIVTNGRRFEYSERGFDSLRRSSTWSVWPKALKPGQTVTWSIPFEDIVRVPFNDTPFLKAIESGEVVIEDFWGFR